jgi:hypothetical protein
LSPTPFITPTDIVNYLGRGSITDPGMLMATDAACDMCRTIADQSFNRGTTTEVLDGSGTDVLLLRERPVNSAGTVTVAGGTITDYVSTSAGLVFRGTAGGGTWPTGRQNVRVTYDHGYEVIDVPRDVRMVAVSIAARLVTQGPVKSETVGGVSVTYSAGASDVTPSELLILNKYRQIH